MRLLLIAVLLLTIVIFLGYNNTFESPFVFDDNFTVVGDSYVTNFSFAASDWRSLLGTRGLRDVTLGINHYYSGLEVTSYHVVNTALHILASCMVFLLARLLSQRSIKTRVWSTDIADVENHDLHGLLVALVFAAHPIQTMAVTNITQRSSLLLGLFYVLAMFAFMKARLSARPAGWWALLLGATGLALVSRETAATLPVALALLEWLFLPDSKAFWRRHWLLLAVVGLLALTVPGRYLGLIPIYNFNPLVVSEWAERLGRVDLGRLMVRTELVEPLHYILTEPRVIMRYLGLLLWPVNQNADWDIVLSTSLWRPLTTAFSFIGVAGLAGLGFWLRRRAPLAAFGLLFFLLALSIESSIIILPDVMFEYRLYLPTFGIALVLAQLVSYLKRPATVVALLLVLTTVLTVATYRRNLVWASTVSFWSDVVEKSPNVRRAHKNLSVGLLQAGDKEGALYHAERVVEIEHDHASGYRNLGAILTQLGRLEESEAALERALELEPDHPGAYNNLGNTHAFAGRWHDAVAAFERSLELEPTAATHQNLATAYANLGRYRDAVHHYEQALALDPSREKAAQQLRAARRLIGG